MVVGAPQYSMHEAITELATFVVKDATQDSDLEAKLWCWLLRWPKNGAEAAL